MSLGGRILADERALRDHDDRIGLALLPPRLHDASDIAYYGVADSNTVDTIEYAYLQGHEGVFTETQNGFEVDGLKVKCRHVFGAKAIDWRGLFKNAGA